MPADPSLYPPDWPQIAADRKRKVNYVCERCGEQCYRPGESCPDRSRVMSVHHIDHNPANCHPDNLIALCSPCHLAADAAHHARNARRTRAAKVGQIWLPQMEYVK